MKTKSLLQDTPVWLYTFVLSILLGATVYQTMVILPEFTRNMPDSMIALAKSQSNLGIFGLLQSSESVVYCYR